MKTVNEMVKLRYLVCVIIKLYHLEILNIDIYLKLSHMYVVR